MVCLIYGRKKKKLHIKSRDKSALSLTGAKALARAVMYGAVNRAWRRLSPGDPGDTRAACNQVS